jgi:hypothetical protein
VSKPDIIALRKIVADMREKATDTDVLRWADEIEQHLEGDGFCTWRQVSDWARWYTDCDKYDYCETVPKTCPYCNRKATRFP